MRTFLVTYADGPRVHARNRDALLRSAVGRGIDVPLAYGRDQLPEAFRSRHRGILEHPRGAGYWLWKPYVILDALRTAGEGDIIVYLDAGILVRRRLEPLLEQADRHQLILVKNFHLNAPYVKRDCFVLTGTDTPECHEARQLSASYLLVKNTETNRRFVEAWLEYCADARILTDLPNVCGRPNLPGFIGHRHDQAVLSVLYWRERDRLPHLVHGGQVVLRYLRHHRRRSARVPIWVWYGTPRRVRNWIVRRWRALRARDRSAIPERRP